MHDESIESPLKKGMTNKLGFDITIYVGLRTSLNDSKKIVSIDHVWKSKRVSPERFTNTHEHLFVPHIPSQKEARKAKIVQEDLRGKHFNIVTGDSSYANRALIH